MGKRGRNQLTGSSRRRALEPDAALARRIDDVLAGRDLAAQATSQNTSSSSQATRGSEFSSGAASNPSSPQPSLFQSSRPDAPVVASLSRGSHDDALAAASSEDNKRKALATFEEEKVARSSRKSRDNNWNVWCSLHRAWFHDEDYLPLTTTMISGVSALSKAG